MKCLLGGEAKVEEPRITRREESIMTASAKLDVFT